MSQVRYGRSANTTSNADATASPAVPHGIGLLFTVPLGFTVPLLFTVPLVVTVVLAFAALAAGCSNPSLESIVGLDPAEDIAQSAAETDGTLTADSGEGVADDDDGGTRTSVSPLGVETTESASLLPAPTAVFDAESEATAPPIVTGAYLVARTGAGRQVAGSGGPAFILPVYDEPEGTQRNLVYTRPNGSTLSYPLTNPSYFGNPLVLRVVSGAEGDEWIQVQAPIRPAERSVWVEGSNFDWFDGDERVEIDLNDSTLRAYRGEERVLSTRVALGAVDTPTPLGLSYVSEIIGSRSPIFNLALFANTNSADGQPLPAITLVGTANRSELGERITRGTIRAPNDLMIALTEEVSAGALVLIFDSSDESTDRDAIAARELAPAETIAP